MARILDVGCGSGGGLLQFVRLGFNPANLTGIDSSEERIEHAKALLPAIDFQVADASRMPFSDESFDLVFESTMLGTLESQSLLASISAEMIRVTKKSSHIMLADWRYSRKGSGVKTAISPSKIAELFDVGDSTIVVHKERGALGSSPGASSLSWCSFSLFPRSGVSALRDWAGYYSFEKALSTDQHGVTEQRSIHRVRP